MVNFFPNRSSTHITNGTIDEISFDRGNTLLTVSYNDRIPGRRNEQTVRLIVGNQTIILDERGNPVRANTLMQGMIINAVISSAMTRSIPPQANAFLIRIVRRPRAESTTTGRILEIDAQNQSFTTISDGNRSSIIRFNTSSETRFLNRAGRAMNFSRLMPGMMVRVQHANFMTASIPPQTTAFEVRVL